MVAPRPILRNIQILLVRHGQAKVVNEGDPEESRVLTQTGREQAKNLARRLGENFDVDHVITSGLIRTRQTAEEIVGAPGVKTAELGALYQLPDEEARQQCLQMFLELKYSPLGTYLAHEHGQTVRRFGEVGARALIDEIIDSGNNDQHRKVMVVGHAVLLPAILMSLCPETRLAESMLSINLAECQAVSVILGEDGELVSWELIAP